MRLEYDLRFSDYLLFHAVHQFLSLPLQIAQLAATAAVFFALRSSENLASAVATSALVYLSLWVIQLVFNAIYLYSSKNKTLLTTHVVELQDDAFYDETRYHRSYHYWGGIQRVVRRPGFVAVYINAHMAHIIPGRAFSSKEDVSRFRSLAGERLHASSRDAEPGSEMPNPPPLDVAPTNDTLTMSEGFAVSPAVGHEPSSRTLGTWWRQGARSAFLLKPSWSGLKATPAVIAWLIVTPYLFGMLIERLYIVGDANFNWWGFQIGWLTTALTLWICWVAIPESSASTGEAKAPTAVALFSMLAAQVLTFQAMLSVVYVPLVRAGLFSSEGFGLWVWWTAWIVPLAWGLVATCKLTWQNSTQRYRVRFAALLLLGGVAVFSQWARPTFCDPSDAAGKQAGFDRFELTQEIMEQQPKLLAEQLQRLAPQRSGVVDVYAITYAPYADEDVFRRESAMVADVMAKRFDARARTIQLVNHRESATELAWATPLNLKRAIDKMASLMKRDEDILLVHLTSHGARDGTLSTHFWPLSVDAVTPTMIRGWLDAANIRYRIVSVTACYSGSWVAPLESDGTLVMTAADAEHTSFGCGRRSDLTYFGRAMFDEQLRRTWSFEDAHASARVSIEQREREAGKSDGFSNPQIRVGSHIKPQLARLAKERAAQSQTD